RQSEYRADLLFRLQRSSKPGRRQVPRDDHGGAENEEEDVDADRQEPERVVGISCAKQSVQPPDRGVHAATLARRALLTQSHRRFFCSRFWLILKDHWVRNLFRT